jgi:mRNA-decapping enzyme subunit 2
MDELLCRFIINLPQEELTPERVFFHIQEAHWYYSDFLST